ncbi:MAG: glutaredoxin [Chlamydiae bacterium]|nr:glutaredoxin [Chlamydiota bacterium]
MFKKIALFSLLCSAFAALHAKDQIHLFSSPGCPYCKHVTRFLDSQGKEIEIKDVSKDAVALRDLVKNGGRRQVPCLYYNGQYIYESQEIIAWLRDHQNLLEDTK